MLVVVVFWGACGGSFWVSVFLDDFLVLRCWGGSFGFCDRVKLVGLCENFAGAV